MKKTISLLLTVAMMMALVACGTGAGTETTAPGVSAGSALEILENTWNAFPEGEKFSVYGGDMQTHNDLTEAAVENGETYTPPCAPGNYDMTYAENLPYMLQIPEELMANVDEAATMVHMMLANNFTTGVLHLTEGTDVDAFTASVHDALVNNHWMCGFPEKELVAVIDGEYVLLAFGLNDMMTPFQTHFVESYPDAQILYNADLI